MLKKILGSTIGSICSFGGILGIILSNAVNVMFLFVLATISGLFVLALTGQKKWFVFIPIYSINSLSKVLNLKKSWKSDESIK